MICKKEIFMKSTLTNSHVWSNSLTQVGLLTLGVLSIPFVAMQISNEVNWGIFDFIVAGIGVFTTSLLVKLIIENAHPKYRTILILAVLAVFLLIWVELAVGIFGSPFAGS
jgi:hypothetical protein